jgi:GNAT superfamily N-acetyltransferase
MKDRESTVGDVAIGQAIVGMDASGLRARCDEFAALLEDAVIAGASVGFLLPDPKHDVARYWQGVAKDLDAGDRTLLAFERDGRILGTVQVDYCAKANGRHRAEIQKLLVVRSARRQGIGAALMRAAEEVARNRGRWLLLLDTREGTEGDALYRRLGWTAFGRVVDYARDPDGALAACVFFMKRIEGTT